MRETRPETLYFQTTKARRKAVERIAKERRWSVSQTVDVAVEFWLHHMDALLVDARVPYDGAGTA